jgi:hypothetical protein
MRWETCRRLDVPNVGVFFGQVGKNLELDLGGSRVPVQVDGVEGWLWRLGTGDFTPPWDSNEFEKLQREWKRDKTIYIVLLEYRRAPDLGPLGGVALALQWNKNGNHFLLVAQDKEPMSDDTLQRIANSLVPLKEWPPPQNPCVLETRPSS